MSSSSRIPTLTTTHSGVPARLKNEADAAKERLYSLKTLPDSVPRKSNVKLPPNTSQETLDAAITALTKFLGKDGVEINNKPLVDGWYMEHPNTHDAYHVIDQEEMVCSAITYPSSTSEVQAIVKWANEYTIPIWPISMGRNIGYGGAAPRVPGSVVVDLGRNMNKVLKIDGGNATCMVEPGVSYFKLYEEIQKTGLPLWIDTPDLGGGSVLGNAIDRGVGYTPYGDHFANRCGMEVVLPDGSLLRTGMGALPGKNGEDNPTWESFQHAYGPSIDGIFSQSNFGIVTKMGFWLMPASGHQSYMITFPREDDFPQIVEIIRPLALKRVLGNIPQLRHAIQELAVTGQPRTTWYNGPDRFPREVVREGVKKLPVGDVSWVFYGTQYGDEASIFSQLEIIKSAFLSIPGSKFYLPSELPSDHYIHSRVSVCSGVPVLKELDWLNWKPNAAHLFFSPIVPTSSSHAKIIHTLIDRLHEKWGFDTFPTICVAGREMHYIANIVYNRANEDEKRRARGLMREMISEAAKEGFGEYRTHLLFADQVAKTYGWNGGALRRFNETIKDALDPKGILAPGRNGIWPKSYRGKRWELVGEEAKKSVKARL
ncbi:glycolate oxidase [Mollisia scopiformis]|uniref:Glycolate oxidase n=1 Tax=Mollisia scopiformis TaxID=149040 RepID=A0A194XI77_MOLSC|nr:glycolate oxidase [Mollisia scopiformis]KUJ19925.1 glycolate oxidase [Mollisia scopiformis]